MVDTQRETYAGNWLGKIQKICGDKSLDKRDVHIIFHELGLKTANGTNNKYSYQEVKRYVNTQEGQNKIKLIYQKLYSDPKENAYYDERESEEKALRDYEEEKFKYNEKPTNDSWRFNPSFASDMAKASDDLLAQDDVYYGEHRSQFVRENKRKIFLSEAQIEALKNMIEESNSTYPVNPRKVEVVAKYLNNNFERGGISTFSEDGYPKTLCIVGMKGTDGKVARNMDAKQLFYLLQDKFKDIYLDKIIRDKFLKQVMKDWYNKKISKQHLLSVNVIK